MDEEETLHQAFAKVVDASFAFTEAFNEHGAASEEAHAAHASYEERMAHYKELNAPFQREKGWEAFCAQRPDALECKIFDL